MKNYERGQHFDESLGGAGICKLHRAEAGIAEEIPFSSQLEHEFYV